MMCRILPFILACLLVSSSASLRLKLRNLPRNVMPVLCPDLKLLAHMTVEYSGDPNHIVPGDEAWIRCTPGYVIRGGSDQLICEEDGSWDEEMGRCEAATCKIPEVPTNGDIPQLMDVKDNVIPEGFEVTYSCGFGFRLTGSTWNKCVGGKWRFDDPQCAAITCYDPGTPENGLRRGNNFEIGSKVTFSCFSGYTAIGSFERYCLPNGQWSGELSRCNSEHNYCPDPGVPINGIKSGHMYNQGFSVKYQCHPGFTLIGSETRECQQDRSWTGVEPKCQSSYDFDNNVEVAQRLKAAMKVRAEFSKGPPQLPQIPSPQDDKDVPQTAEEPSSSSFFKVFTLGVAVAPVIPSVKRTTDIVSIKTNLDMFPDIRSLDVFPDIRNLDVFPDFRRLRVITYFVFDSSGSIGTDNFRMCIAFAKALVRKMEVSIDGNRVAALSFNSEATIHILPSTTGKPEEVLEALDEIEYVGGGTAINKAFEEILDIMLLNERTLGPDTKSVIYLFTDGKANMGGDPKIWAKKLKEKQVEINCIGIAGAQENDFYKIASEPIKEHVFTLSSYGQMHHLIELITNDEVDYSQCGFGLEDVIIQHNKDGRGESMKNASRPWPWMAALYISKDIHTVPNQVQCGGSILGRQWILTAAHCLRETDNNDKIRDRRTVIIKLGVTNVKDESTAMEFSPQMFIFHPEYDARTSDYDVALIKLERPMEYNAYVRPVCLPPEVLPQNTTLYKNKEYGFVTGWGSDEKRGPKQMRMSRMRYVKHLKVVIVEIQSSDRCQESLRNKTATFTESMFCAGSESSDVDMCKGDSGGPMVQSQLDNEGNIYWVQVGIVSWGIGCRQKNEYGVYANVHRVREWITDTTNSN